MFYFIKLFSTNLMLFSGCQQQFEWTYYLHECNSVSNFALQYPQVSILIFWTFNSIVRLIDCIVQTRNLIWNWSTKCTHCIVQKVTFDDNSWSIHSCLFLKFFFLLIYFKHVWVFWNYCYDGCTQRNPWKAYHCHFKIHFSREWISRRTLAGNWNILSF